MSESDGGGSASDGGGSAQCRRDEVASAGETCGWYMYDFANSPYYQVYVGLILPSLLKWLAEEAALQHRRDSGAPLDVDAEYMDMPVLGISAGSFPLVVNVVTCFFQVLCFLTFAPYADYGSSRKRYLVALTWAGGCVLLLSMFCLSGSLWWLAGLVRVVSGILFGLSLVYYNAYLPVLADAQPEVIASRSALVEDVQCAKSEALDRLSSRGMMAGYAGGAIAAFISYIVLLRFECAGVIPDDCSEFDKFFWPNACLAMVAIWWVGFAQVCFAKLGERPGPPMDDDVNVVCFGWAQAYDTLCYIIQHRNMLFFMIAYYIYSDAYNTLLTIAPLILESQFEATLSDSLLYAFILPVVMIFGIWMYSKIQSCLGMSTKTILLVQLIVYAVAAGMGSMKVISTHGTLGLYAVFVPTILTLGSIQANSRSLFAELIPAGMEAAMFAFYEITDKGSNFVGTAVSAVVHNKTSSYEGAFLYVLPAVLCAAAALSCVDTKQAHLAAAEARAD